MVATDNTAFPFKVNGVQLSSDKPVISVREILQLARDKGAIPQTPDKYMLKGEKGEYGLDNTVDLREDNLFIAIPTGGTPVALLSWTIPTIFARSAWN